jgi:hypothetical protein
LYGFELYSTHKVFPILSFISRAALLVNVTAKISEGLIHFSFIIYSILAVRVAVFHDHAQAIIKTGHSILFFAFSCSGFKFTILFF